jgi:hypothetical protein
MKVFVLLAIAVMLAGCGASSPKEISSPTGQRGFALECLRSREGCLAQAGSLCGSQGYYVTSESSHAGGALADWLPGPVSWFNIQVVCGESEKGYVAPPAAAPSVVLPTPSRAVRCRTTGNETVCVEE